MSYPNYRWQVTLGVNYDLNALADIGTFSAGMHPVYVVGCAVAVTNLLGGAGEIRFDKTDVAGTRGDGDVAIIVLPDAAPVGRVIYKEMRILLNPGEYVTAQLTNQTAASDTAMVVIELEEVPARPADFTNMVETT